MCVRQNLKIPTEYLRKRQYGKPTIHDKPNIYELQWNRKLPTHNNRYKLKAVRVNLVNRDSDDIDISICNESTQVVYTQFSISVT
jgi:hypothetical protein